MESEETLRWPTNLDRNAIVLDGVESKSSAEIAKSVMAALDWLQRQPELHAFALQLQMVALNLKNLR